MRRFVALSLSFFILVNSISNSALAALPGPQNSIKVAVTSGTDLIEAVVKSPTGGPVATENLYIWRIIEIKLKNPEKLPPNSVVNVKFENPTVDCSLWGLVKGTCSFFKDMLWDDFWRHSIGNFVKGGIYGGLLVAAQHGIRKSNVLSSDLPGLSNINLSPWHFVIGGATAYPVLYEVGRRIKTLWQMRKINDFKNKINEKEFEGILVQISNPAKKIFLQPDQQAGEMKEAYKNQLELVKKVESLYGPDKRDKANRDIIENINYALEEAKKERGKRNPKLDYGDTFNVAESGNINKISAPEETARNLNNYVPIADAENKNRQNQQNRSLMTCKISAAIDSGEVEPICSSNFKEKSFTLTKENPSISFIYGAANYADQIDASIVTASFIQSYPNFKLGSSTFNINGALTRNFSNDIDKKRYEKAEGKISESWTGRVLRNITPPFIHSIGANICNGVKEGWGFVSRILYNKNAPVVLKVEDETEETINFVDAVSQTDPPQAPQSQNNQQPLQNPYNNNTPNYYASPSANSQEQPQSNQPPQQGVQQPPQQRLNMYGEPINGRPQDPHNNSAHYYDSSREDNNDNVIDRDLVMARYNDNNNDSDSGVSKASENDKPEINSDDNDIKNDKSEVNRDNSKNGASSANENDNDWPEAEVIKKADLNAIPQGKNRDGNSSRNSTQSAFKTDD